MRCAVVFGESAGARSRSVVHGGRVTVLQRFTTCCNSINHVGRFRYERHSQRAMPLSAWLACCPVMSSCPVLQHRAGCMSLACRVHERHGLKALAELLVAMYMARCRAQHVAAATTAEPPFAYNKHPGSCRVLAGSTPQRKVSVSAHIRPGLAKDSMLRV
jgi:hypothetical protein